MQQKPLPNNFRNRRQSAQPMQDIAARKQAAQFPSVGVTLHSYKYNALATNPHPARAASTVVKTSRFKRFRQKFTIKRVVLVILALFLITGGWLGFKLVYNAHKIFGGNIFDVLRTTKLKGEDSGRVNILLAGNSADDPGHDGANLTDSIMIMSIDTKDNTGFLLSVPRDLYVNIPGAGSQKINDAYPTGQSDNFSANGLPSGGMGLLEQIIQQDFGINIDYYALIDYSALRDAVNAVGGIQVNIQSSDPRGLYDPSRDYTTHQPLVKLTNGEHTLDGEQALDLARARGDAYGSYGFLASDFERTQNQRLMIVALKNKVFTTGVLSNPDKLGNLADAIGNNMTTDFKLSEIHRLYNLVKNINSKNIQSLDLDDANGKDLLTSYTTPDGQSSLIPAAGIDDYDDIQNYVSQITSTNPLVREGATVVVLNATDTSGLASIERAKLTNLGINVASIADANATQTTTTIIDTSDGKMPATRKTLEKLYGNHFTTTDPYSDQFNADFIVLIGNDRAADSSQATTSQPSANAD